MNDNWRNRPTTIDTYPEEITHIISIDESGDSNLQPIIKAKYDGTNILIQDRYFTALACMISTKDFFQAGRAVMNLKYKYWDDATFMYQSEYRRVCFHSRDIRRRTGAFSPKLIDYDAFINDLSKTIVSLPLQLFVSGIDKVKYVLDTDYPESTYNTCMSFILGRLVKSLGKNESCIVICEARGTKEDKELLDYVKALLRYGTRHLPPHEYNKIKGVYFNPKWCKANNKATSYWELEIADLCAYPFQKFFTYGTQDEAFKIVLSKLHNFPDFNGHSLKIYK